MPKFYELNCRIDSKGLAFRILTKLFVLDRFECYFWHEHFQFVKKATFVYFDTLVIKNLFEPRESFLVGAFSFKEKSPSVTMASFFSFFFVRPQSSSRMYHFLQKLISSLRPSSTNANLLQRAPFRFLPFLRNLQNRKTPKGPPFQFFFGTVRIFFRKFLMSQKSPPFGFFCYFATESMLMNPKGSPLFIFQHYATFSKFF